MINPKFPGPWVIKEQERAQTHLPVLRDIFDPEEEFVTVRFMGRARSIWVRAPREDTERKAAETLGNVVREILLLSGAKAIFDKESLGFEKPLGPCAILPLGVPFFAAISTTDVELARKMALDRIVYAISAVRHKHFEKVQAILQKNNVEMVTK